MRETKIWRKLMRLLRLNQVKAKVGLSRSTIYRLMQEDSFPKSIILAGRSAAWIESEIDDWILQQVREVRGSDWEEPRHAV